MSYASKQNMIDRFGQAELVQLTDRAIPATGLIDDTVVNKALADADAEINGYLIGQYQLPLASVPANLELLACDIARFRLFDDRATEQVRQRYDDAVKYLTRVGKGELSLVLDQANNVAPPAGGPKFDGPDRTFSRDKLSDYL